MVQSIVVFLGQPNQQEKNMFPNTIHVITKDETNLFETLRPYSLQICKGIQLFKTSHFSDDIIQAKVVKELQKIIAWSKLNMNTINKNEKKYINHLFNNLKHNLKDSRILFNKYKNKPCIIVGAGSSLDNNIHHLINQNKAIVIATPPVLNKLNALGIKIDYVVSISPNNSNLEHFHNVKKYPSIVFDGGVHGGIINKYDGDKYISMDQKPFFKCLNKGLNIGEIQTGMCVSHYAFNVAVKMGCNPIIFIGQDLALTNNTTHATKTAFREMEKGSILIKSYDNKMVRTNIMLKSYLDIFELMFKQTDNTIYNCTEGGANIKGAENRQLQKVLKELEELKLISFVHEVNTIKDDQERKDTIISFIESSISRMEDFQNEIKINIKQCDNILIPLEINDYIKVVEQINNWKDITPIIQIYDDIMDMMKHLILEIYLKKDISQEDIKYAIIKKNSECLKEYIIQEKETLETINNNLEYIINKYKLIKNEY